TPAFCHRTIEIPTQMSPGAIRFALSIHANGVDGEAEVERFAGAANVTSLGGVTPPRPAPFPPAFDVFPELPVTSGTLLPLFFPFPWGSELLPCAKSDVATASDTMTPVRTDGRLLTTFSCCLSTSARFRFQPLCWRYWPWCSRRRWASASESTDRGSLWEPRR